MYFSDSDGVNINNFKFLYETVFKITKENFCFLSSENWNFTTYNIYQNNDKIFSEHLEKIEYYFSIFKKLNIKYVSINNISYQILPITKHDFVEVGNLLHEIIEILENNWKIFQDTYNFFLKENIKEIEKLNENMKKNNLLIKNYKNKIENFEKQKCSNFKNIILKIISFGCYDWNKSINIKITNLNNEYEQLTIKNSDLKRCKEESLKQIENLNNDFKKVQNYSYSLNKNISILQSELVRNESRKYKKIKQFEKNNSQSSGYFSRLINWSCNLMEINNSDYLQNLQSSGNSIKSNSPQMWK